ncbi:hypothetical protein H8959_015321 [Pygathrix nigripes]
MGLRWAIGCMEPNHRWQRKENGFRASQLCTLRPDCSREGNREGKREEERVRERLASPPFLKQDGLPAPPTMELRLVLGRMQSSAAYSSCSQRPGNSDMEKRGQCISNREQKWQMNFQTDIVTKSSIEDMIDNVILSTEQRILKYEEEKNGCQDSAARAATAETAPSRRRLRARVTHCSELRAGRTVPEVVKLLGGFAGGGWVRDERQPSAWEGEKVKEGKEGAQRAFCRASRKVKLGPDSNSPTDG